MRHESLVLILTVPVFMAMVFGIAYQGYQINSLQERNRLANEHISILESRIEQLKSRNTNLTVSYQSLNTSYHALYKDYINLTSEYEAFAKKYENLRENITLLIEELETYEKSIDESMSWFSDNAFLTENQVTSKLREYCHEHDNSVRTGCIYFVNEQFMDYHYKNDWNISEKNDKLQSLESFISNKGGDCEDYALFYKAEYNYLSSLLEKPITLKMWFQNHSTHQLYWLDSQESWFLDDVQRISLSGYDNANVVCGNMFDLNTGTVSGHCVIAFSKHPITLENLFTELNNSVLVEPQNGAYVGRLNKNICLPSKGHPCSGRLSHIFEVITDNDFYIYENEQWISYSWFQELLSSRKQSLQEMLF